jgi:hypothetical protein
MTQPMPPGAPPDPYRPGYYRRPVDEPCHRPAPRWLAAALEEQPRRISADVRRELERLGALGAEYGRLRSLTTGDGRYWGSTSGAAPISRPTTSPPSLFDLPPRIVITRGRWTWSIRLDIAGGFIVHQREDGGPYAWTRRRAEAKGRRMLRRYLHDHTPREEHTVDPGGAR